MQMEIVKRNVEAEKKRLTQYQEKLNQKKKGGKEK